MPLPLPPSPGRNPSVRIALHERLDAEGDHEWHDSALCSAATRTGLNGEYDDPCLGRGEVPIALCKDSQGAAVDTELNLGNDWRITFSLQMTLPPPPQDQTGAAVLHIVSVVVLPPRPVSIRLRAAAWQLDLGVAETGRWVAPHAFVYLARPAAQPLYTDVFAPAAPAGIVADGAVAGVDDAGERNAFGGAHDTKAPATNDGGGVGAVDSHVADTAVELVGTARLEVGRVGGAPEILWAPVLPRGDYALKIECALLPQGAASEWSAALKTKGGGASSLP